MCHDVARLCPCIGSLKEPRLPEGVVSKPQRVVHLVPDDCVVHDFDIEHLASLPHLPR